MIRFRLPFVVLTAWLFVLFNIERLHAPLNFASFVYAMAAACACTLLLFPRLLDFSLVHLLLLLLSILLVLKVSLGYPIAGASLPVTYMEFTALAITVLSARWAAIVFAELRTAVFCNLVSDFQNRSLAFDTGQGDLYREVRRARFFERPLAFLAMAPVPGAIEAARDRVTEEVMRRMHRQYVEAQLADLLTRRLKDCDVITRRNGHFVAALPEADRDTALKVSRRLQRDARKELGIELRFGICACPDEEATFIGLLQGAEAELRRPGASSSTENHEALAVNRTGVSHSALHGAAVGAEDELPLLSPGNVGT